MEYTYYLYESAVSDAKSLFTELKLNFKDDVKEIKHLMKEKNYTEASSKCRKLSKYIDDIIEHIIDISKNDDDKQKTLLYDQLYMCLFMFASLMIVDLVATLVFGKALTTMVKLPVAIFFGTIQGIDYHNVHFYGKPSLYISILLKICNNFKKNINKLASKIEKERYRTNSEYDDEYDNKINYLKSEFM